MADFQYNRAKGRVMELFQRVDAGDPAAAALYLIPVDVAAVTDATLKDLDDFAAVITAGVTERNANGWNRKTFAAADITTFTVDDTGDKTTVTFADQTWTPTAGASTDLILCYASVATPTNAQLTPLLQWDFAITPDGSLVTADAQATVFESS